MGKGSRDNMPCLELASVGLYTTTRAEDVQKVDNVEWCRPAASRREPRRGARQRMAAQRGRRWSGAHRGRRGMALGKDGDQTVEQRRDGARLGWRGAVFGEGGDGIVGRRWPRARMQLSSGTSKDGNGDLPYPWKLSTPAGPV